MDNFEKIKNQKEGKVEFKDEYLQWGTELYLNLDKLGINGSEAFENDVFKIVPYDWDGGGDCTCYFDIELDKLYDNGANEDDILGFENTHMHDAYCNDRSTNFYHKTTGISIEWRKSMSRFEYINKKITYEEWQEIVQDCVKSVLKDKYTEPIKEIKLDYTLNFDNHKITKKEFIEKFNRFVSDNGWNII